jgi:hypothetical protein
MPATAPATAVAMQVSDAHWREVVKGLGSDEYSDREAAQKDLDRATFRDRDVLKKLAGDATDEEVKGRVLNRLEAIDEELALNPPPVTLEIKDAPLGVMALALGKALGTSVQTWPQNQLGNKYTLSAKEQPFWEVFRDLSRQHGLWLQGYNGLQFNEQQPGMANPVITGSLAVFPMTITRSREVNFQRPGEETKVQPDRLEMSWTAALDPRVRVVSNAKLEMQRVVDDAGNVLYENTGQSGMMWGGEMTVWQLSTSLDIPDKLGKKIVSAKGALTCTVALAEETLEVADPGKKLHQELSVGAKTVVIDQFDVRPAEHQILFNVKMNQAPVMQPLNGNPRPQESVRVAFIDAMGRKIWSTMLMGGCSGGCGGSEITPPVKVVFSAPT